MRQVYLTLTLTVLEEGREVAQLTSSRVQIPRATREAIRKATDPAMEELQEQALDHLMAVDRRRAM